MNWGKGIAILYTSFVLFIAVMVYMAFGEKYDLVTEDYYQKEIEFQSTIDKKENTNVLGNHLKIGIKGDDVLIEFPQEQYPITGSIHVFRPSDITLDFEEDFAIESNTIKLSLDKFKKGKYIIKTDWKVDEQAFYQEEAIIIP